MLNRLFASREKKLGEAIAKEDLPKMAQYLELGVRKIDYMRMQPADFDNGKTMIPMCKYDDPGRLAKDTGLNDQGLKLLQQYGLGDGPAPRSPGLSR